MATSMNLGRALVWAVGFTCFARSHGAAVDLTAANFDKEVFESGKNAMVKFYAPWCGHCKAMKPAWDELGSEFEGSRSVIIADVDCTADVNKDLCEVRKIDGFPTVKVFTSDTGKDGSDYEGGRDFETLKAYVSENLAAKCLIAEPSACTEKEVGFIAKMRAKGGKTEVVAELKRLESMKNVAMSAELKKWLGQRVAILKQLSDA